MENPTLAFDQETEARINAEVSKRTRRERVFVYIVAAISIPPFLSAFSFNARAREFLALEERKNEEASTTLEKANATLKKALEVETEASKNLTGAKAAKARAEKHAEDVRKLLSDAKAATTAGARELRAIAQRCDQVEQECRRVCAPLGQADEVPPPSR